MQERKTVKPINPNDEAEPSAAERELFTQYIASEREKLYWFVFSLLPDHHMAEDVLQKSCLVMWSKFRQFQVGTSFTLWAKQIIRYEALLFRRGCARDRLEFWPESTVSAVADVWDIQEEAFLQRSEALTQCLQLLPARDHELVRLRYGNQRTTGEEIGRRLGRSRITIYKALARIRKALIECVERKLTSDRRA